MKEKVNPTVVITGASTGIGKTCAIALDELGYQVFAGVRKWEDADALKQLASERLTPVIIDICDRQTLETACQKVRETVGDRGLDALINNAGIAIASPLEFIPIEELRKQLDVNVCGQIATTQVFLPLLRQARGRIVNMGSVSGKIAFPFLGPYCASKFALEALTDSLRMELQPWGIAVSLIEPASINTPIWHKSLTAAEKIIDTLPNPTEFKRLYGEMVENIKANMFASETTGIAPEHVAKAAIHAIASPKPKTRYLVEEGIYVKAAIARFPDRFKDWLISRKMGLHPK